MIDPKVLAEARHVEERSTFHNPLVLRLARALIEAADQVVPEDEEMQEWVARTVNWTFCEEDYDTFIDKPRAKSDALAFIRQINAEMKRRRG